MNSDLIKLKENAGIFGLNLSDNQLAKFELFNNFLQDYNKHTNLVSANDINLIYQKHLFDSLSFYHFVKDDKQYKILDIGSGGGFPVIAIANVLTKSKVIALDSTKKKTDFIKNAAKIMNLNNLEIINDRAEKVAHDIKYRSSFDIVTARAVGALNQISELCIPFLKLNGKFIAYKSAKVNEEIEQAQNAINILGGNILEIYDYKLNLEENYQRNLVYIEKLNSSPDEYPRNFSTIKSKPII